MPDLRDSIRQSIQSLATQSLRDDAIELCAHSVSEHPDFISNRGNHTIATSPVDLRKAMRLADNLFIESNLSANGIRDVILRCLAVLKSLPIRSRFTCGKIETRPTFKVSGRLYTELHSNVAVR